MKKAVQATHRSEEIVISSHKMMKEVEGRRTTAMKASKLVEKKSQELTAKLVEVDQDKKSAEATLDVVERQAEAQRK